MLTPTDSLHAGVADFIEAEDIEHVVIVGGADSVSDDVANAVSDAGVDTGVRIAGDTAAGTSVALAGLLTGDCKDDLAPVSDDMVALVNRDALPDGVADAVDPVDLNKDNVVDGDDVPQVGDTRVRLYFSDNVEGSDADAVTALEDGATVTISSANAAKTVTVSDLALTFDPALEAGDRITISSGAVADAAKNKSLQRSFTAIREQASPRITSVLMSSLNHSAHAVGAVPASITNTATPPVTLINGVATGYAADVPTTGAVNEEMNGASQVRISRSSAVEAPK